MGLQISVGQVLGWEMPPRQYPSEETHPTCPPRLWELCFSSFPSRSLSSHPQLTFIIAATYNFAVLKLMGRGTKF